jgi:3-hydroxyacyl-[acyl-carrier-protein] dehydratase
MTAAGWPCAYEVRVMRWYWIDRFVEFESGRRAKAVKMISLAEEHLHDHFPGNPVIPNSLVIEGIAQTGGLLLCEASRYTEKVVLAKVPKAIFHSEARAGDCLLYTATIEYMDKDGAMVSATSYKGDELQAEMEVVFAHLNDERSPRRLIDPESFLKMMRILRAYEVGRAADGSPLVEPPELLEARTKA